MMHKLVLLFSLMILAAARFPHSRIRKTPWTDCGSSNLVINDVQVEGCSAAPCLLVKETNVSISITFTPKQAFSDLTNKLYGIIGGFPAPFPLPEADVCKLGVTCPMTGGSQYVQVIDLWIQSSWPNIQVIGEWKIDDPSSGNAEGCFTVPLKIADKPKL